MSKYTTIKKSKNLRFKFLTLMYLIFIVMAMQQVPIGWLKNLNPTIQETFQKPTTTFEDPTLLKAFNELKAILDNFNYRRSEIKTEQANYNSYLISQDYFINQQHSNDVFRVLTSMKNWAEKLPETDGRKNQFNKLFKADLDNGLNENDLNKWEKNRFKKVPTNLVVTFLQELQVRTMLLSEAEIVQETLVKEPLLSLMVKYRTLRVGDEAVFSVKGDSLKNLIVTKNGLQNQDYELLGMGFILKPSSSGLYEIIAEGNTKKEKLSIEVLPAGFPSRPAVPLRVCYKGLQYSQLLSGLNQMGVSTSLISNNAPGATLSGNNLIFTPTKEGWCRLTLKSSKGVLFDDSVFVKNLPDPRIRLKNIPLSRINKNRLLNSPTISVEAFHPAFKNEQPYKIESFKVRIAGKENKEITVKGNQLQLSGKDMQNAHFLVFSEFIIKQGIESNQLEQNLVLQID